MVCQSETTSALRSRKLQTHGLHPDGVVFYHSPGCTEEHDTTILQRDERCLVHIKVLLYSR